VKPVPAPGSRLQLASLSILPDQTCDLRQEIAGYSGVTVRTAQVSEQERGLHVRRLPGPRGRVYAAVGEIESWKSKSGETQPASSPPPEPPPPSGRLRLVIAAGLFLAAVFGRPAQFKMDGGSFVVMDSRGRELWRKPFEVAENPNLKAHKSRAAITDLDGDGRG
jgi:hypothetical protein